MRLKSCIVMKLVERKASIKLMEVIGYMIMMNYSDIAKVMPK